MPAPSREIILTEPLAMNESEPVQLRKRYPPQARAVLQGIRMDTLIVMDPNTAQQEIVIPSSMRNFARAKEHHRYPGMERTLPEDVHVRYLVMDLLHDPAAYVTAGLCYGVRVRLRYDADADLLEGRVSPWASPVPDGETIPTLPEWTYAAAFQLTYHIPY